MVALRTGRGRCRCRTSSDQDTGNIRAFSIHITTDPGANVTATKTVAGAFAEGGTVNYTVIATNSGGVDNGDNTGNELTDVLPAGLSLVSATATSGTSVATVGTNTVTWNGSIAAGGSVTITITATVDAGTEGQTLSNQATVAYDADGNGSNESSGVSDDPGVGGASDPTSFSVAVINPSVTIDQAVSQADPTAYGPIRFTAVFSEPVTGFDASDVTLGGTAGATTAVISGAGPTYDVDVSGMTGPGTVVASIPAAAAAGLASDPSLASTSTDNVVTYQPLPTHPVPAPTPPPSTTITLAASSPTITWGTAVRLSVHLGAGGAARAVRVLSSTDGVAYATLGSLTTDANGDATLPYRPATNLYYRATFDGAADLQPAQSDIVRVVVRQIALLRPTHPGRTASIARGTAIQFTTTVRPARPELARSSVSFRFYHLVGRTWALVAAPTVSVDANGLARWTWTFDAPGSWYVRSVANPTTLSPGRLRFQLRAYPESCRSARPAIQPRPAAADTTSVSPAFAFATSISPK